MNSKTIAGLLLSGSLFIVSCKKELQPQESAAPAEVTADGTVATPATDPAAMQMNAQPSQPVPAPQPVTTAPGMNPPHGEPNHRCDIAVGAPLNSPAGQAPAARPQAAPQVQPQPVAPAPAKATVTAPGMNPPHGEPGHRCEIAVGAPLPQS